MSSAPPFAPGALDGVRVLDLSRILAGPTCTQLLGDLGADVIKVENPKTGGDDTRTWGPPFVEGADGPASESAYYLSSNRNKRSIAVDVASPEGQARIKALAKTADVVIENFKPGALDRYGLGYEALSAITPGLVHCSISGFGQTGPNRDKPGYDLLAQGFGGIMSLTGAPDGPPMKVGVGIADVMCGMYACVGILAALRHRDRTGEGQRIDLALADAQVAWLVNEGVNHLTSGRVPERRGNGHPNIVPYNVFPARDGHLILAVGNDGQFRRLCDWLGRPDLADDPRFLTNPARLANREAIEAEITAEFAVRGMDEIVAGLEACGVPAGPVNTLDKVFASEQVAARRMRVRVDHPAAASGSVELIGNPLKFGKTPVTYRRHPPTCGEHDDEIG